ncbi:hypothetical protein E2C01_005095 [Portunus trituberculatus]|uniref:Uncharacterized protein n=1 Tax=Portunus trituberculatus TaxID=210409 RepID=A0A5B7CUM8_PORTR|nr:hypothetical protein [Portunus trituberculatus]
MSIAVSSGRFKGVAWLGTLVWHGYNALVTLPCRELSGEASVWQARHSMTPVSVTRDALPRHIPRSLPNVASARFVEYHDCKRHD